MSGLLMKSFVSRKIDELWREQARPGRRPSAKREAKIAAELSTLRKAHAGWLALSAWLDMPEEELGSPSARALALAGLGLVEGEELRRQALRAVATHATRGDKPTGYLFCVEQGLDPMAESESGLGAWEASSFGERAAPGWLPKAMSAGAWRMAELLAGRPEGAIGVPGAKGSGAGVSRFELAGLMGEDEAWGVRGRSWIDEEMRVAHPTLSAYARDQYAMDGCPAKTMAALEAGGFGPQFDDPVFTRAAVALALEGSDLAFDACQKAGAKASAALGPDGEGAIELARAAATGWSGEGGPWWSRVAGWIDGELGEGWFASRVDEAALEALAQGSAEGWHSEAEPLGSARWLASRAAARPELARERLALAQGWALELAQEEAGRPRSELAKALRECMDAWGEVLGVPAKRRLLKV